jgi:hypothetical protein
MRGLVTFLILALSTAAQARAIAGTCNESPEEAAAVAATVKDLFTAMERNDVAGQRRLIAPGFYLYEHARYDSEGFIGIVAGLHSEGKQPKWGLSELATHAACGHGWATWHDEATFQEGGKPTRVRFLESAVLHRAGDHWVLDFLHSTRLTP